MEKIVTLLESIREEINKVHSDIILIDTDLKGLLYEK